MVPRGRGSLVFMASVAGIEPMAGLGAYGVSKSGLLGLMRALAQELGPRGVRVNALAPGLVETRFAAALFADQDSYRRALACVADLGYEPELLIAPTRLTSSGWRLIDAIHRAAAFYNTRAAAGISEIHLRVFVLPRPI